VIFLNILRLKAVSQCIGIRRSSIAYFIYDGNKIYDVSKYEHPLNSIKTISFNDNLVSFLDIKNEAKDVIPFNLKATSLGQEVSEVCYLEIKLMDINDSNLELVKNNFNQVFDESLGEYEFIYGYYLYMNNRKEESMEYFKAALDKGFKLAIKYYNN